MIISFRTRRTVRPMMQADEELKQRLLNFLYTRGVPQIDQLRVTAYGGTVLVSGAMDSQHAKWLCLECCRRVAGVIKLVDRVEVDEAAGMEEAFQQERLAA